MPCTLRHYDLWAGTDSEWRYALFSSLKDIQLIITRDNKHNDKTNCHENCPCDSLLEYRMENNGQYSQNNWLKMSLINFKAFFLKHSKLLIGLKET